MNKKNYSERKAMRRRISSLNIRKSSAAPQQETAKVDILGLKIDNLTREEVLGRVKTFLESEKPHQIVTLNPEMVMLTRQDENFKKIINQADLVVADGIGLIFASYFLGQPLKQRFTGVDLVKKIAELIEDRGYSLYLLGARPGVAKKAAQKLQEEFPRLKIRGAESGGKWDDKVNNQKIVTKINQAQPDILLLAFGHNKQEKWIKKYLEDLTSIKIAIGVGGTFDYISRRVKYAPNILRRLGLEWLWRLILEPWRFKRIINATIKFSWSILKNK